MNLTIGNIRDHIKNIAFPAGIGLFFTSMFNIVDTFFGGMISTEALAALSISFPLFFMIIATNNGINTGGSALIANALGEESQEDVRLYSTQVLSFGFCCALFVTVVGFLASPPLLEFLGAKGELLTLAETYIQTIFLGSIFFIMTASANAILVSHGNAKTMRNFLMISFVLNCILDPWFLFGGFGIPAMGLRGIAIATVCVMFIGTLTLLTKVVQAGHLKGCSYKDFIPRYHAFMSIMRQSFPASLNIMSIALGIFVTTYYVKKYGEDALAAFGVGMRIQQIILLPNLGISVALVSIIGQNSGAGFFNRIKETVSISLKYGAWFTSAGAAILLIFPEFLISLFSHNEGVVRIGVEYLRVAAFSTMAYLIMAVYTSAMQGMKRPNFAFILGTSRQVFAPIIVFYIVVNIMHLSIFSLWISILCIAWTAAIAAWLYAGRVIHIEGTGREHEHSRKIPK